MTARNAPCPCGSGKKFKQCHGQTARSGPAGTGEQLKQASILYRSGKIEEALAMARALPGSAARSQLLLNMLISRRTPADIRQALGIIDKWKRQEPANPEPVRTLLEIRLFQQDMAQARLALHELEKRVPGHGSLHYYRGVILQLEGRPHEALQAYAKTIRASASIGNDGSRAALKALHIRAAMQLYETAIGNYAGSGRQDQQLFLDRPVESEILRNSLMDWDRCKLEDGRTPPAEEIAMASDAWYNLGCTEMADYGRNAECIDCFRKASQLNPDHELARLNKLFALNYTTDTDPAEIFAEHAETGSWLEARHKAEPQTSGWSSTQAGPLRIGYLSSDFCAHSVAHFILPVIERHDRAQFSVYLYHNGTKTDDYTARARNSAHSYQQVLSLDDVQLRRLILRDRIDILVDLNGMTQNNRMAVLASRAAPIQASWIGYPNTTGLKTVDYRIVDGVTDPEEYAQALNVEKLLYMPKVFSVYEPPADLPPVAPAPCLESGVVTFGSFNNLPKLNDELISAWVDILDRVPGSRLLIKNVPLSYDHPRKRLLEAFSGFGLDTARLELAGKTREKSGHLAYYQRVDICLDTFPYSGTTTTCDSLMMGLPVITRAGRDHRSRVSASQLTAMGLQDLVANGRADYIDRAVALALDHDRLLAVRDGLRERLLSSPLTDARAFTRELESKYQLIWSQHCTGQEQTRES